MIDDAELEVGRSVFREANDAFFIVHPQTLKLCEVNPAAQRLTGLRRKQLLELTVPELFNGPDAWRIDELVRSCQTTSYFVSSSGYSVKTADDKNRSVHVSVSRIHTEPETLALIIARDITDEQMTAAALATSERRFRELLDEVDAIVWEADARTWQFTYVCPRAIRILGFPAEDWYGENFWVNQLHPDDREWAVKFCSDSSQTRDRYEFDYRMIAADGRAVWLHDIVNVVRGPEGPRLLRGFIIENTQQKTIELALRESEARQRALLVAIPDSMFHLNRDGIIIDCTVTGKHPPVGGRTAAIGRPISEVVPNSVAERFLSAIASVFDTGTELPIEYQLDSADGRPSHWEARLAPVGDSAAVAIVRDVTERVQAQNRVAQLLGQVINAQENERARVARELHDATGQTLTFLLFGLRAVLEASSLDAVKQQATELHRVAGKTLEEVQYLARALRPSALDDLGLVPALERLADDCHQLHNLTVRVDGEQFGGRRLTPAIETTLYRIAQEAITNAAKHAKPSEVRLVLRGSDNGVSLSIHDDGRGFDATRVLETVDTSRHLGLSTMRERASLAGGRFEINSQPGWGTTISVELPL